MSARPRHGSLMKELSASLENSNEAQESTNEKILFELNGPDVMED